MIAAGLSLYAREEVYGMEQEGDTQFSTFFRVNEGIIPKKDQAYSDLTRREDYCSYEAV
jgi:hypothetical protein